MIDLLEKALDCEENLIANLLEENTALIESLEDKRRKPKPLTLKEKKMILSELKDIYDIEFSRRNGYSQIIFHFKRIDLYLDPGNRIGAVEYRKIPFYYLWKLGFIKFKTSKSKVVMTLIDSGLGSFESIYENDNQRNFHDWGLNCWGGWSNVINSLIDEKKFYDAALHIVSRMKQVTINDGISSFGKMCQFEYENKPHIVLNDQEAEFFKDEIYWLTHKDFGRDVTYVRNFVKDVENDSYYVDLHFQYQTYRLSISNRAYEILIRG